MFLKVLMIIITTITTFLIITFLIITIITTFYCAKCLIFINFHDLETIIFPILLKRGLGLRENK